MKKFVMGNVVNWYSVCAEQVRLKESAHYAQVCGSLKTSCLILQPECNSCWSFKHNDRKQCWWFSLSKGLNKLKKKESLGWSWTDNHPRKGNIKPHSCSPVSPGQEVVQHASISHCCRTCLKWMPFSFARCQKRLFFLSHSWGIQNFPKWDVMLYRPAYIHVWGNINHVDVRKRIGKELFKSHARCFIHLWSRHQMFDHSCCRVLQIDHTRFNCLVTLLYPYPKAVLK